MYEIELKAHLASPAETERRLARYADFSSEYLKKDSYWNICGKTLRLREEANSATGDIKIFVTNKMKSYRNEIEVNKELEFELPYHALDVFTEMLGNLGFVCGIKKQKRTKVFLPHPGLFTNLLHNVQYFSVELSEIPPLGSFLEIELLYPDYVSEGGMSAFGEIGVGTRADTGNSLKAHAVYLKNAEKILYAMLDILNIPHDAVEPRPYAELLADIPRT